MTAIAVLSLIVCCLMACCCTTEPSEIAGRSMTLAALRPPASMLSRIDPEVRHIMIHRIRAPDGSVVAASAIPREELADMVGIRHPGIIGRMALVAVLIGEGIVAVRVTMCARDGRMRPRQWEFRGRVIERCRLPGILRMAGRAIVTEPAGDVIRVDRSAEGPRMAIPTGSMGKVTVQVVLMALVTIHGLMGPHEREGRRGMTERGGGPHSRSVA
jgi:hypothetical protein